MAWSSKTLLQIVLVLILGFSHTISMNYAIPLTRTKNLMHERLAHIAQSSINSLLETREDKGSMIKGRMGVELEDYPGSGPNDRHTPRAAQLGDGV